MVIQWIDTEGPRVPTTLPRLIKSYIDPKDPSKAAHNILRLAHLLLLSNHLTEAHEIASGVFRLGKNLIERDDNRVDLPLYTPISLEIFWQEHQEAFPRPEDAPKPNRGPLATYLAKEQWGKYRECTRTGWMLDRYGLAEPEDPLIWRETDDPKMLAMCARLLAKTTTPGTYPPQDRMREALAAGQKLYAMPEIPIEHWLLNRPENSQRQCWLLYRRLIVEMAIRVGEQQTAADILGQALRVDGFANGGTLGEFLMVPGIYDVLPLLARGGKETNPFFIPKADAEVMVKKILEALELRAKHGRQWALDESKVGWKELLNRLAEGAFKTHPKEYRAMGVKTAEEILYDPATEKEIKAAEKKVGKLPDDLKDMVRVANGFQGGWHLFGGGIAGIQHIGFDDGDAENSWDSLTQEDDEILDSSDLIELQSGSESDGFYHYYMRPTAWNDDEKIKDKRYRYWHWAPWMGSIARYNSVRDYVASCVEEVEEMLELGEKEEYQLEDESQEED
ncbi:hypothetical protein PENANT_c004G10869 [Penicillium antarcticum]|uniref:Knr4/Smi1-like domain-containing protein n=1 Tax=Penicillium antarcticum TaxID=416450 RepID=A0A1V6QGK3_9EURO|nr:uncharacterized protein N7508_002320 [Penicillium antarcticum]KAJ5317812.1 hypothetical protein N7508_002320 [Penicillium antarcticum]OQD88343.1 hypothetical protein PENANT_c004G10869 [Penicillium antarcticum]